MQAPLHGEATYAMFRILVSPARSVLILVPMVLLPIDLDDGDYIMAVAPVPVRFGPVLLRKPRVSVDRAPGSENELPNPLLRAKVKNLVVRTVTS